MRLLPLLSARGDDSSGVSLRGGRDTALALAAAAATIAAAPSVLRATRRTQRRLCGAGCAVAVDARRQHCTDVLRVAAVVAAADLAAADADAAIEPRRSILLLVIRIVVVFVVSMCPTNCTYSKRYADRGTAAACQSARHTLKTLAQTRSHSRRETHSRSPALSRACSVARSCADTLEQVTDSSAVHRSLVCLVRIRTRSSEQVRRASAALKTVERCECRQRAVLQTHCHDTSLLFRPVLDVHTSVLFAFALAAARLESRVAPSRHQRRRRDSPKCACSARHMRCCRCCRLRGAHSLARQAIVFGF